MKLKTGNNLYLCLLRWRINLKSSSFIWCTSLVVSHNFKCGFVRVEMLCFYVLECVCLWSVVFFVYDLVERSRLRDGQYPLVARVLYGPCEKISKIFITEADLGEEVTYDVSLGVLPPLSLFSHRAVTFVSPFCAVLNIDTQWYNGPVIDGWVKFSKLRKGILFRDWCNNGLRWPTACCDCTQWYK